MTDPALSTLIDAARRRPGGRKLCRTVVRLAPEASRSALVRAMTLWPLAALEGPERGAS